MASKFQTLPRKSPVLGMQQDRPTDEVDDRAWVTCRNVHILDNKLVKIGGWKQWTPPIGSDSIEAAPISLVGSATFQDGTQRGVVGTPSYLYEIGDDGIATALNATAFSANPACVWEMDEMLNDVIFTNYFDPPQDWSGAAGTLIALDGTPPNGYHVQEFQNHIVFGNIMYSNQASPYSIANSNLGTIADWDFSNYQDEANMWPITAGNDPVMRMLRCDNYLVVYKQWSIHMVSYVGGTIPLSITQFVDGMGTMSSQSVCRVGDIHYYVGQDDVYSLTSSGNQRIGQRVWDKFYADIMPLQRDAIVGFADAQQHEVVFGYRSVHGTGDPDMAYVYHYLTDSYSIRDWPFTAAGYVPIETSSGSPLVDSTDEVTDFSTRLWDATSSTPDTTLLLAGDINGQLWAEVTDPTVTPDLDVPLYLESGDTALGDEDSVKMMSGMRFNVPTLTGSPMQVWIGWRDDLEQDLTWDGPYLYDATVGRLDFTASGRWFRFKFIKPDGFLEMKEYAPIFRKRGNY